MENAINWFEIGTTDIDRATKFYEAIFSIKMFPLEMEGLKMSLFPVKDMLNNIGGALVHSPATHRPSGTDGVHIYLNGNPDVQLILDRVEAAGGKILEGKTQISPEYGYMAFFLDTEGNRIGIQSAP